MEGSSLQYSRVFVFCFFTLAYWLCECFVEELTLAGMAQSDCFWIKERCCSAAHRPPGEVWQVRSMGSSMAYTWRTLRIRVQCSSPMGSL